MDEKIHKCPCGAVMTKEDKENAYLCIPCWCYDATVNHNSNLTRI